MWYLYAMEFYLSISKNEVIEFAGKKKNQSRKYHTE